MLAGIAAGRARRRPSSCGGVVLITGGSRGLGLELARQWAASGAKVAICARTRRDLAVAIDELTTRGHQAMGVQCDVRSEKDVANLVQYVMDRWGRIDVLVNNAGIIQVGPEASTTLQDFRDAMETHVWGPLYAIRAVLPQMRARRSGHIVNIASIGGMISVPHMLPYSASKFALVGLSQGMHAELRSDGVSVTTVCPGLMRTGSPRNARFKGQHRAEYAWFSISGSLPLLSISSQAAARQIIRACERGQAFVPISIPCKAAIRIHGVAPGLTARMLALVNRFLPAPGGIGRRSKAGYESSSSWSPSPLTRLNERAAARNNEIR